MNKWQLVLPKGRWMGGQVLRFRTKTRLLEFMDRWNTVSVNKGESSLTLYRFGPYRFEAQD